MSSIDWRNLAMEFLRIATIRGHVISPRKLARQVVFQERVLDAIESAYTEMIRIEEFHKRRQMFLMSPSGEFRIADRCLAWSHQKWVDWLGQDWAIVQDKWIRGFYWPETDTVYFYIGSQCFEVRDHALVKLFFANRMKLMEAFGPPVTLSTKLAGGMEPARPGELWKARKDYMDFRGIE